MQNHKISIRSIIFILTFLLFIFGNQEQILQASESDSSDVSFYEDEIMDSVEIDSFDDITDFDYIYEESAISDVFSDGFEDDSIILEENYTDLLTTYPVCGILSPNVTTQVTVTTNTYYQLNVEENGWYSFIGEYYPDYMIVQEMAGIKDNEVVTSLGAIYDSQYIYLESGLTYYLRFYPQYWDSDEPGGGVATEFLVTLSRSVAKDIRKAELLAAKTCGIAYVDNDYFKGTQVSVTLADGEEYQISPGDHLQNPFHLDYFIEQNGQILDLATGLPAGDYTCHIRFSPNLDITYKYQVINYSEMGLRELSTGKNSAIEENQYYLFTPDKTDNYSFGESVDSISSFIHVKIWDTDNYTEVTGNENELFTLQVGKRYLIRFYVLNTSSGTVNILAQPSVKKVEGFAGLNDTYLAGVSSTSDPLKLTITYSNGEKTKLNADTLNDKYLNRVRYQYTDKHGKVITSLYSIVLPKEAGTYQVLVSLGDYVFLKKTIHVVNVNAYAKTLKKIQYEKPLSVVGSPYLTYTPKKSGTYYLRFTNQFALTTITEGKNGKTVLKQTDYDFEPPESYEIYMKSGKTYIFTGMIGAQDGSDILWFGEKQHYCSSMGHLYLNSKCTVCGKIKLATITPTLKNTASGIKISWKKVKGATSYVIYRKTGNGAYKKIKTISNSSTLKYTDKSVKTKHGKTYTYAVRAKNKNVLSKYKGKTIKRT